MKKRWPPRCQHPGCTNHGTPPVTDRGLLCVYHAEKINKNRGK